jgi:hypothetical protein
MKKDEILKKCRNNGMDEREQDIALHSFGIGGVAICILAFLFSIWKAIHGERFYEFGAIIFVYLSATNFYQYKNAKDKHYLTTGIFTAFATIVGIAIFLIQG